MTPAGAILGRLKAAGLYVRADGGDLVVRPKEAVTDELRSLMRAHKAELLAELQGRKAANEPEPSALQALPNPAAEARDRHHKWNDAGEAEARKVRALAYLEAHPEAVRACFADLKADPAHVILTVALREPWAAVEVLVDRSRFDAMQLLELSLRYPGTSVFVPEH